MDHKLKYPPAAATITNKPILSLEKLFLFAPEGDAVMRGSGTKVWAGVTLGNPVNLVVLRDEVEVEVDVSVSVVSVAESESVDLVRVLLSGSVVGESVVDVVVWSSLWV